MLNRQFRRMNSVQIKDNVILVGERHYDSRSVGLVQSVLLSLDELEAIAVEKNSPSLFWSSETAMDYAEDFAADSNISRYYIDKSSDWIYEKIGNVANADEVISDGNTFSKEPEINGDVALEAICDVRQRIRYRYGEDTFNALYTEREIFMAEHLTSIKDEVDGYVVAVVGVFHIFALLDFMDIVEDM